MNEAENIYAELWEKSIPLLEQGSYEVDPLIGDPADTRRGLTLRSRLSPTVATNIQLYTEQLKARFPNPYYTAESDLHLTLLTVMSCSSGFQHPPEMDQAYSSLIAGCVRDMPAFRITFRGITVSPACLLVCGYPEDTHLQQLRDRLREQFLSSSLPGTVDLRYPRKTAHVTIMRFTEKGHDLSGFTRFIKQTRNHSFGTQSIDTAEFVANDWCHRQQNTRLIRSFPLG